MHRGFTAEKVTFEQVSLRVLGFSLVTVIPLMFCSHSFTQIDCAVNQNVKLSLSTQLRHIKREKGGRKDMLHSFLTSGLIEENNKIHHLVVLPRGAERQIS